MELPAPSMLGRFKLLSLLDKGAMGEVYLAYDVNLHRNVALKLLPAEFTQNKDRLSRFKREAFAVSRLDHPNIITIHDIGEQDGHHFIVTEYIEGENLRQHMSRTQMELREILNVAAQVASALAAAHQKGIVHRDIKLENIMLHADGYVKVLDFGLAKLATESAALEYDKFNPEGPTMIMRGKTEPGVIVGTISYMSPEQVRCLEVDARTDIWSLGVVLYEMVTGRLPFEGKTMTDVLTMILHREPPSLLLYNSETPTELERIVEKALTKEREERYQLAKELRVDLKKLKQHLEVEAEKERSVPPEDAPVNGKTTTGSGVKAAGNASVAKKVVSRKHLSGRPLLGLLKRHKKVIGLLILAALVMTTVFNFYLKPKVPLTDKDMILLVEFKNATHDEVFDKMLQQGLAMQLAQSPFLNIYPDAKVRQVLLLMRRSADDHVTKDIASEICQRQGLKAYVGGSIEKLGNNYVITLEAFNGQSGEELASAQEEAASKEQVLKALSLAASTLRKKLGESLSSVRKFDASLELTTSSLEALKAFSLGYEQSLRGNYFDAIPHYRHATELDANFAYAYSALAAASANNNQPRQAAEYAQMAFKLRDRVSELEKLRISYFYYSHVSGELDKAIEVLRQYKQTYPRDFRASANLSDRYLASGQFDKAVEEANEALRLNQDAAIYGNLGLALIRQNRFSEAQEIYAQAKSQQIDATFFHAALYQIAFIEGGERASADMQKQLEAVKDKNDAYVGLDWQTQTTAFAGQWEQSQKFSRTAVSMAQQKEAEEVAAQYASEQALRGAAFGLCQEAKAGVESSLKLQQNNVSLSRNALALNLCGYNSQAEPLIEHLEKDVPTDTFVKSLWLPLIQAAAEINRQSPAKAIELLEAPKRYEAAAEFWPQYLRGQAYLRLKQGPEAAAEFRKILEQRGQSPLSALYPLAQLGLARAATLTSDINSSREGYDYFFALWKDADKNIPLLQGANQEYEKLK